jgi:hypothetical protein
MHESAPTSARHSPWENIDRLREAARLLLKAVEVESGPQSALLTRCRSLWQNAEREAAVSLLYSDFKNAAVRLDQALRALTTPGVVQRGGPGSDDRWGGGGEPRGDLPEVGSSAGDGRRGAGR